MNLEEILKNEKGKVYLDYEYLKNKILKKYPNLVEVKYVVESYKNDDFEPNIAYVRIMFLDKEILEHDKEQYEKSGLKSYVTYTSSSLIFNALKKASIIVNDNDYMIYQRYSRRYELKVHKNLLYSENGIKKEELDNFLGNIVYRLSKMKNEEITKIKNKYKMLKEKLINNEILSEEELKLLNTLINERENFDISEETILKMSLDDNK